MAKRTYKTPEADMLIFDYKENVVAASGELEQTGDASHCFNGRNQGQCLGNNWKKCGDGTGNPGQCHN